MVNFANFSAPVINGVESLSMPWSLSEKYFDFGGKSLKIEEIKAEKYKLTETKSHESLLLIVLKIVSIPVLGLLFLGIRHYFRKKYEHQIITLPGGNQQTEEITRLKSNVLPPPPINQVDEVKVEVDLEDAKNVKEFKESFSLLFTPPESGQEEARNEELAKALKTGYKILEKRLPKGTNDGELAPWGEFNSCYEAASEFGQIYHGERTFWSENLFGTPFRGREIGEIYAGDQPLFSYGYEYLELSSSIKTSSPAIKGDESKKSKLIVATSGKRKYALLQKTFHVHGNHFAVMAFDPIRGNYVDCNNFASTGKEVLLPEEGISELQELFSGKGYKESPEAGRYYGELWIDLEYIDLFLNPDDWKGLNWVLPKWESNNCYLAASWLEMAYKMKISEIFFKRSGVEAK